MKCPHIVRLFGGRPEEVECPDPTVRCWNCRVGSGNPALPRARPGPKRFYEEQA